MIEARDNHSTHFDETNFQIAMRHFTWVISIFSIIATALPFIQSPFWLIRIFDFPRLQIAVVCLISIILCLIYIKQKKVYQTLLLSLLAIAFSYQASKIIVYTPCIHYRVRIAIMKKPVTAFRL
jgi:hypothetical protein